MREATYVHIRNEDVEVGSWVDASPTGSSDFVTFDLTTDNSAHSYCFLFWSQKQTMLFLSQLQYQVDKLIKERSK